MDSTKTVYVTGGGGYVGSALVPALLDRGYKVRVLDLFLYGEDVFDGAPDRSRLTLIKGDLRDARLLRKTIAGSDAVIHLACISDDPSYALAPALSKSINYDAFIPLVDIAKAEAVQRFVYASSSRVYGVRDEAEVTEDLPLAPLTDYAKYKAMCEMYLNAQASSEFTPTTLRPATICGYAPRLRLDLPVNRLTAQALDQGEITVCGGGRHRPNLHIRDMVDAYLLLLEQPADKVYRKIYNVGCGNLTIAEIAEKVKSALGSDAEIRTAPTEDARSYRINSDKIAEELGFVPRHTVEEAILDLKEAFEAGLVPDPMNDLRYYNIKRMQALRLK